MQRKERAWPSDKIRDMLFDFVARRDGRKCWICSVTFDLTLDHVDARSRGGSDRPVNLRILCRSHNSQKEDKPLLRARPRVPSLLSAPRPPVGFRPLLRERVPDHNLLTNPLVREGFKRAILRRGERPPQ
ncbi:MAG: HNH endonuclease signature motif containing protein [Planctomycetota bacterium]|nr:HNH endonuclease signature motif containing protein [Planctomycetota bacterium]